MLTPCVSGAGGVTEQRVERSVLEVLGRANTAAMPMCDAEFEGAGQCVGSGCAVDPVGMDIGNRLDPLWSAPPEPTHPDFAPAGVHVWLSAAVSQVCPPFQ